MNKKKFLSVTCLAAAVFTMICLPAEKLAAQSNPPVPAPTPGSPAPESPLTAQITMDDDTGATLKIPGRHARRVLLQTGQRATVALKYGRSCAGLTLGVTALDGGTVSFPHNRNLTDPDGMVVLQFSGAQQPGLYRLRVNCGGTVSTLRFWVPDPNNPGGDPAALVPQPSPRG